MENQNNFFEENIELDAALGIGNFAKYGIIQHLTQNLSQDMSDF